MTLLSPAVFLDRDGVLNEPVMRDRRPYAQLDPEALSVIEGVGPLLAELKALGFLLIVVTNQPDVARGTVTREAVERIHERLRRELPALDAVFACFHDDEDGCTCRKPRPGLLLDAARSFGVDLGRSFLVGDRWRDVDAGRAAGCTTVFVDYGWGERAPSFPPDACAISATEALERVRRLQEARGA